MTDTTNTITETTVPPLPDTATRAEGNRQIRIAVKAAGLGPEFADGLIDRNATITESRAAAFDELIKRGSGAALIQTQRSEVGFSNDDPAVQVERMAEALACRMMGGKPTDAARPYINDRLETMARRILEMRGQRVGSLSCEEVFTRAMHTTNDFPMLTTEAGNRVLMAGHQAAPNPLKSLARQALLTDFRAKSALRLDEMGSLQKVGEHGEIKSTTRGEAKESYALDTYGSSSRYRARR